LLDASDVTDPCVVYKNAETAVRRVNNIRAF
jgi:hypothetical protein